MKQILILLFLFPLLALAKSETVVYNVTDNLVILGNLSESQMSIASISKLMTVYTVLNANQNLDKNILVQAKHLNNTKISRGMTLTRLELIKLSLICSDNLAAQTLSENFSGGKEAFIREMNKNAQLLGMTNSKFVEPTGLSPMNYSSVSDIVKLTNIMAKFDIVREAAQSQNLKVNLIKTIGKRTRNITVTGHSTSHYFGHEGLLTIKTGFTNAAGFCITMLIQSKDKIYTITVLGANSKREREQIVQKSLILIYQA